MRLLSLRVELRHIVAVQCPQDANTGKHRRTAAFHHQEQRFHSGFAVVASEVKALAIQTGRATEEIAAQIQDIQDATGEAVNAIAAVGGTIAEVNQISGEIAAAVDQQGAATHEIAGNLRQAADRTKDVNKNIVSINEASEEASSAAARLLDEANALSSRSDLLKVEVESFLGSLQAA